MSAARVPTRQQTENTTQEQEYISRGINNGLQQCSVFMERACSIAFLDLQGSNGRKFAVTEAATRQIFLPDYMNRNKSQVQTSNNILRRIHIQKIFVQPGTANSFPFPLGLKINNMPCNDHTMTGDSFNYILPSNFKVQNDICIFESSGDENLMQTWEEDFARWNSDNLETLCAMKVPDSDIVMVHLEHPVVQLLDKQYEKFGTVPPSGQRSDTLNWRQIQCMVFEKACVWLRDNILSKSGTSFDMTSINVQFSKIDNTKFTDLPPSFFLDMPLTGTEDITEITDIKNKFVNVQIQKPFSISIKLGFVYRLPTTDVYTT